MIYSNDDPMSLLAMERERTENYSDCGEAEYEKCPVCGAYEPEHYYLDEDEECVGCSECIYKTEVLF